MVYLSQSLIDGSMDQGDRDQEKGMEVYYMADIRFDGRVAVVTGAGAGIGRIYALELAQRGAKVVVNDLGVARDGSGSNQSAADVVVDEIKRMNAQAVANYDSVSTLEGGKNIIKAGLDAFGKIDILINNAGILRDKTFHKMTEDDWDMVISVHLKGAFCVTQPAIAYMREAGYGRIIFTSSTSGIYGNFGQVNYAAAKMGLVGMMNALKQEVAKYDIMINTVAPNAWSRMTKDIFPPEFEKKMAPQFNSPLVLYLCSEDCKHTGMIFVSGAGWYGRTAIVSGSGACIGNASRKISVEEIRGNFDKIMSIEKSKTHDSGAEIFQYMTPLLSQE
jgi:NAD(P)-dependent dehydrogenase (short-subunit alcohol dehydrogenase family)